MKRAATAVLDNGGFIRNLDYVGDRRLPSKTFLHNAHHDRGQYFILKVSHSKPGLRFARLDIFLFKQSFSLKMSVLRNLEIKHLLISPLKSILTINNIIAGNGRVLKVDMFIMWLYM